MKKLGAWFILFLMMLILGCSPTESSTPQLQAEETALGKDQSEVQVSKEVLELGEKTVKTSCIGCHSHDLTGDMGPSLHHLTLSKEEIIEVLKKGRGSMPPATAKDKEKAVAEYLETLK